MIFRFAPVVLTAGVALFGLLLLAASIATRGQRPRALLHKAIWLVLAGLLVAWALGGALLAAELAAMAGFNHAVALAIGRSRDAARLRAARLWLAMGIAVNLLGFAAMKHAAPAAAPGAVVVGISFVTLHAVSLLADVTRGRARLHGGVSQSALYLVLLPLFVAGPISFHAAAAQLARRAVGMSDFAYGVRRLAIGVGKRAFIAVPCAEAVRAIFSRPLTDLTPLAAWTAAACMTVEVYFTFSAFADMAIGLGRLFGLRMEENFRWPYAADSIGEFWRRWHMGLAGWFGEYIASSTSGRASQIALLLVPIFCGVWYGPTWGCVIWGAWFAALLSLERYSILSVARAPFLVRHAYVVAAAVFAAIWLRTPSPADGWLVLRAMSGLAQPLHVRPLPLSLQMWGALVAGGIGSVPLARALRRWSVAIDGATTALVMMLFASVVFVWKAIRFSAGTPKGLRHI